MLRLDSKRVGGTATSYHTSCRRLCFHTTNRTANNKYW